MPHLSRSSCVKVRGTTMLAQSTTRVPRHLASQMPVDSHRLTMDEVVTHLVGHTVEEVERELILHTLFHYCGNRTQSASVLGISIRCMRNKIHECDELGIAVPAPGASRVRVER
jgi:DNA-binding NtrC family response regulator